MNILLTNDDGYKSVGFEQLCQGLSNIEGVKVYVVAPNTQKSGYSHAIEFHKAVLFEKLDSYFGATAAYISEGTPANCTNFGLNNIDVDIDFVISGPNAGPNYGYDILYSGTVGGAEEAAVKGVKGMAVSLNSFDGSFDNTVKFVVDNLFKLYESNVLGTVLNVNVPNTDDIKGVVVTKQSDYTLYHDYYEHDSEGHYFLKGHFKVPQEGDDDVSLCNAGYITMTALGLLRTDDKANKVIKDTFKL